MLILFAVHAVSKGVPISHLRDTFLATDTFFKALLSKEKRKKISIITFITKCGNKPEIKIISLIPSFRIFFKMFRIASHDLSCPAVFISVWKSNHALEQMHRQDTHRPTTIQTSCEI